MIHWDQVTSYATSEWYFRLCYVFSAMLEIKDIIREYAKQNPNSTNRQLQRICNEYADAATYNEHLDEDIVIQNEIRRSTAKSLVFNYTVESKGTVFGDLFARKYKRFKKYCQQNGYVPCKRKNLDYVCDSNKKIIRYDRFDGVVYESNFARDV